MNKIVSWLQVGMSVALLSTFVVAEKTHAKANLFTTLPENCPTPDAFAIAPDNSLTLSCPNFADKKLHGELFSLYPNGEIRHLATIPRLNFKNKANPMGIAYGDNGELYVADSRGPKNGRVLKLVFQGRHLVDTSIVISGLNPNGLRFKDGYLYATQLKIPWAKKDKNISAIYRFKADSLN